MVKGDDLRDAALVSWVCATTDNFCARASKRKRRPTLMLTRLAKSEVNRDALAPT
jgi:hypothetical protein